jgi:hypothetical protein
MGWEAMPAVSQAERGYLASKFGSAWMKEHGFDNKGKLPYHVRKGKKKPKAKARKAKGRKK